MGRGRGGQADLYGVEIIHHPSPYSGLPGRISPVAFVGDDDIKGMNRNIQFLRIFFVIRITRPLRESVLPPKEIDRHPLNRGHINKRVRGLGRGEIGIGQDFWIEGLIVIEILTVKALAVNLVFLIKFTEVCTLRKASLLRQGRAGWLG